jgi:hypothetical protein
MQGSEDIKKTGGINRMKQATNFDKSPNVKQEMVKTKVYEICALIKQ